MANRMGLSTAFYSLICIKIVDGNYVLEIKDLGLRVKAKYLNRHNKIFTK